MLVWFGWSWFQECIAVRRDLDLRGRARVFGARFGTGKRLLKVTLQGVRATEGAVDAAGGYGIAEATARYESSILQQRVKPHSLQASICESCSEQVLIDAWSCLEPAGAGTSTPTLGS